ncbi:hypothetical protein FACS1894110_17440 [Spirochaetia bacterium]|nr:hypothetical protein FACS1894110_17440 [Spirochaetia bacterium]
MSEMDVDVLVVGAFTAGLYFGGLMAKQGYKVLICDALPEKEVGDRYSVIHVGREHFGNFGLPEPKPGDSEYIRSFDTSILRSALNNYPKTSHAAILVLRRALMTQRIAAWAKEQGAELLYQTAFEKPLFNDQGKLAGAILRQNDGELRVKARLTVDASGIGAAVRTSLPADYGVENFVTGPRDQFYVVLHYVNLKNPEQDAPKVNITWPYYKTWFASQPEAEGALFGIGANLSFDYAERCFQRFAKKGFLPESTEDHIEESSTPYRRPPYSFVADGFAVMGDAACITNPWSGEGVPYAWALGAIAAEEYGRAMKDGAYPSRESVWNVNVRYQQAQGALFAQNLAMLCGAVSCTEKENDYEFKHAIIYEDETEKGKGNLLLKLLKAFISGGISPKSLGNLLRAAGTGGDIFKHYIAYPGTSEGLPQWIQQADALWEKAGSMADLAERDLAGMGK